MHIMHCKHCYALCTLPLPEIDLAIVICAIAYLIQMCWISDNTAHSQFSWNTLAIKWNRCGSTVKTLAVTISLCTELFIRWPNQTNFSALTFFEVSAFMYTLPPFCGKNRLSLISGSAFRFKYTTNPEKAVNLLALLKNFTYSATAQCRDVKKD